MEVQYFGLSSDPEKTYNCGLSFDRVLLLPAGAQHVVQSEQIYPGGYAAGKVIGETVFCTVSTVL